MRNVILILAAFLAALLLLWPPTADGSEGAIIPPLRHSSTSASSAIWLVTAPGTVGTSVKLVAVEYGWRPVEGMVTITRGGDVAVDRIFVDGFDMGITLVILPNWWSPRTGLGPAGWETDRTLATLTPGEYRIEVSYSDSPGLNFTDASFLIRVY